MGVTVPCRMAMTEKGIYRDIHLDVYFIVWPLEVCVFFSPKWYQKQFQRQNENAKKFREGRAGGGGMSPS